MDDDVGDVGDVGAGDDEASWIFSVAESKFDWEL